jgi:hypothetical protein
VSANASPKPAFLQTHLFSLAFLAAWCVVVGVVLVSATSANLSLKSAFDSTVGCTSAANLSSCRYEGTGRVVRTYYLKGRWHADLKVDQVGAVYSADFAQVDSGTVTSWPLNTSLSVEVWNGRLVRVGGLRTQANPDALAQGYWLPVGFVVAGAGIVLAAVCAWQLVLFREVLRLRARKLAGEDPSVQVLPLTPTMRQFLGALDTRKAKADLERGVFLRESGQFDVGVMPLSGLGNYAAVVSVGGRSLRRVTSEFLEDIPSGRGKVDYLPTTGELVALWDASGHLLAERPGTSTTALQPAAN